MKFHWGWAIATFYVLFMGGILYIVMIAKTHPSTLVTEEYYEKGQAYQKDIDAMKNTIQLNNKPSFNQTTDTLVFNFPFSSEAELSLVCAADKKADQTYTVTHENYKINLNSLKSGTYFVECHWEMKDRPYLWKSQIMIP